MVTSNKQPDKKIVKMADNNNSVVVPQRTLLGEVNEHITCPLCRGYYIDATTIVECLHSFCRSCIIKHLQVKSYCPVCEMMINSAKPNIKLDKALQDIVYKLVPGLFQREMERRQQFYASRPGPAASATPEQRGEDTERIIFSPEDVISFSLEYVDMTDADSISSKSSDSNEPQPASAVTRRYLQCPAVVNISHLKKFIVMKFDIDNTQFAIDILYKRVSLPDCYTLMDIAYIYNWKRNEPMRFFYQIIDYLPIRNRLFDINKKNVHYHDVKSSPSLTEDTGASSPALNTQDQGSEFSSGTDSPMLCENVSKQTVTQKKSEKSKQPDIEPLSQDNSAHSKNSCHSPSKKNDDEVEKSQFLNSFELTAKSNSVPTKPSPTKLALNEKPTNDQHRPQPNISKPEETLKRKHLSSNTPELKKLKVELEKTKITNLLTTSTSISAPITTDSLGNINKKTKDIDGATKTSQTNTSTHSTSSVVSTVAKDLKLQQSVGIKQQQVSVSPSLKRSLSVPQNTPSIKRKTLDSQFSVPPISMQSPPIQSAPVQSTPKTVSPLKLQLPKLEKSDEVQKTTMKKIPDLKPSTPVSQSSQHKGQPVSKVRMDLLANNSDPTIDRSKILSQVKSNLSVQNTGQTSGDPLKSLFDSCKINIPSSLSITLTDQKLDPRNPGEVNSNDTKKGVVNKNLSGASSATTHKVPSPPVHNYIEILKIPDTENKKQAKSDVSTDAKAIASSKIEASSVQTKPTKSSETSTKGPVPNLKPIADTKLGKQSGNLSSPITFQQTFEQQLQSLQSDKKSKLPKNKAQVPKLVPASPKSFSAANKLNSSSNNKPNASGVAPIESKTGAALDLSTPHNIQNQLGHTKVFETMQSIANLAKKHNMPSNMSQNNAFPGVSNRPLVPSASPLRIPTASNLSQMKLEKANTGGSQTSTARQEMPTKTNQPKSMTNANPIISSPSYQIPSSHNSPSTAQPSPRSQTRSPSSSPKLVIAEEKQTSNSITEQPNQINQSSQITSTQLSNLNAPKSESPRPLPGPSKSGPKTITPAGKVMGIRQPITPTVKNNPVNSPGDYLSQPQLLSAHHAILRHQMEMQNAWLKAQRQYDLLKNMSNIAHHTQNEFNKDK